MSKSNQKVEQLKQNGYSLDLGEVISQSFENFKKIAVNAGIATLLVSIVLIIIVIGTIGLFYGFSDFAANMVGFHVSNFSTGSLVFYIVGTSLVGGLMYPFTSGIIQMAHDAEMGREISLGSAFNHYKSKYFKNLFIAGFVLGLVTNFIATLLQFFHFDFIGAIVTYTCAFFAVFSIPLIIFEKYEPLDSILTSFALVIKQPFVILVALIVSAVIAMVGIIGFCIGIFLPYRLFTQQNIFYLKMLSE